MLSTRQAESEEQVDSFLLDSLPSLESWITSSCHAWRKVWEGEMRTEWLT